MNLFKLYAAIGIFLAVFTYNAEGGIILLLLLKIIALKGALFFGMPLALGSFMLGQGVGFFGGTLFGGYSALSAAHKYLNKKKPAVAHHVFPHGKPSYIYHGAPAGWSAPAATVGWTAAPTYGWGWTTPSNHYHLYNHHEQKFHIPIRASPSIWSKISTIPGTFISKFRKQPAEYKQPHNGGWYGNPAWAVSSVSHKQNPWNTFYETAGTHSHAQQPLKSHGHNPYGISGIPDHNPPNAPGGADWNKELANLLKAAEIAGEQKYLGPNGVPETNSQSSYDYPKNDASAGYNSYLATSTVKFPDESGYQYTPSPNQGYVGGEGGSYSGGGYESAGAVESGWSDSPNPAFSNSAGGQASNYNAAGSESVGYSGGAGAESSGYSGGAAGTAGYGSAAGAASGYGGGDAGSLGYSGAGGESGGNNGAINFEESQPAQQQQQQQGYTNSGYQEPADNYANYAERQGQESKEYLNKIPAPNSVLEKFLEQKLREEIRTQKSESRKRDAAQLIELLRQVYMQELVDSLESPNKQGRSSPDFKPFPKIPNSTTVKPISSSTFAPISAAPTLQAPPKSVNSNPMLFPKEDNDAKFVPMNSFVIQKRMGSAESRMTLRSRRQLPGLPQIPEGASDITATQALNTFADDVKKFFLLVSLLDQDKCLQKLVCDVHTKGADAQLTPYESNIVVTFKVMSAILPLNVEDSTTNYRKAAKIGELSKNVQVCSKAYPTCTFTSEQIISMGNAEGESSTTAATPAQPASGDLTAEGSEVNEQIAPSPAAPVTAMPRV